MRLSDVQQAYDYFSGKASELARQLSFAGIAVIWVFRREGLETTQIPNALILPGLFFCLALACDLLHYVAGTVAWGTFHRLREKKITKDAHDPVVTAPQYINWPQNVFFTAKLISVGVGYALLLRFLATLVRG